MLVPRPRTHLLVYHGALAPHAAWRPALGRAPAPGLVRRARVPGDPAPPQAPGRWSWARLLRRVFANDVLVCPRCAGPRRILGAVTEPHAVQRLLGALGLAAQPPPRLPVSAHA